MSRLPRSLSPALALAASLTALLLLPAAAAPPAPAVAVPVRAAAPLLGASLEIEVQGLPAPAGEEAVRAALAEAAAVARDSDPETGGALAALNAAAGAGPRPLPPQLAPVLGRALDVCLWSEGAHGPLGRDLHRLWGVRSPAAALPPPADLAAAVQAAGCQGLRIDPRRGTATLAAGAGLDLWGFAAGAAVDRAADVLRERGVPTALVRLGGLWRGFGEGPAGKGWPILLPALPGQSEPPPAVWLRDRSLARLTVRDRPLRIAGEELAPYLNQRTGRPAAGALAVAVSTERALDAEAVAVALLIIGPREGQLRLGALQPRPAVQWALGTGAGEPLLIEYHWSDLPKR